MTLFWGALDGVQPCRLPYHISVKGPLMVLTTGLFRWRFCKCWIELVTMIIWGLNWWSCHKLEDCFNSYLGKKKRKRKKKKKNVDFRFGIRRGWDETWGIIYKFPELKKKIQNKNGLPEIMHPTPISILTPHLPEAADSHPFSLWSTSQSKIVLFLRRLVDFLLHLQAWLISFVIRFPGF